MEAAPAAAGAMSGGAAKRGRNGAVLLTDALDFDGVSAWLEQALLPGHGAAILSLWAEIKQRPDGFTLLACSEEVRPPAAAHAKGQAVL